MNANGLTRLYDRLSVWERIPLLVAAHDRSDAVEYQRLLDASPVRTWHFAEHLLAEQALHVLALVYVSEQLDSAALYFFALGKAGCEDEPDPAVWLLAVETSAYAFSVNAEAWRRFCSEQDIAPAALTAANYRGWFLGYCEERMPANAPTAESLCARFRENGRDVSRMVTADDRLAEWRETLQAVTHHVPGREGKKG